MDVRATLDDLRTLAVREIGFCVGIHWRSVTGRCVPAGMVSARCRLAYILFSGFAPAYRFHALLARQHVERLPQRNIRLVTIDHDGRTITGVAVIAVISPDSEKPDGFWSGPSHQTQPGYQRYFQQQAAPGNPPHAWWDEWECDGSRDTDRFARDAEVDRSALTERDDMALEIVLDQLEAEYDAKLWWYGVPGRMTKYPPALKTVRELFAYARRDELDLEEVARRNRERQAEQWLTEQHTRDRQQQQALDADQAEIAAALQTPRRGRKHAADQDWLTTTQTLRARKTLRFIYRAAAPKPRRPART